MKKLDTFLNDKNLNIKDLFKIRGGASSKPACSTNTCKTFACETTACLNNSCLSMVCESYGCDYASCAGNSEPPTP